MILSYTPGRIVTHDDAGSSSAATADDDSTAGVDHLKGQTAFFALLSLAACAMAQPCGRTLSLPSKYTVFLRSSPLVCAADTARFVLFVLLGIVWEPQRASAIIQYEIEARFDDVDAIRGDKIWVRWLFFVLSTVFLQTVRLTAVRGAPITVAAAWMFFISILWAELVLFAHRRIVAVYYGGAFESVVGEGDTSMTGGAGTGTGAGAGAGGDNRVGGHSALHFMEEPVWYDWRGRSSLLRQRPVFLGSMSSGITEQDEWLDSDDDSADAVMHIHQAFMGHYSPYYDHPDQQPIALPVSDRDRRRRDEWRAQSFHILAIRWAISPIWRLASHISCIPLFEIVKRSFQALLLPISNKTFLDFLGVQAITAHGMIYVKPWRFLTVSDWVAESPWLKFFMTLYGIFIFLDMLVLMIDVYRPDGLTHRRTWFVTGYLTLFCISGIHLVSCGVFASLYLVFQCLVYRFILLYNSGTSGSTAEEVEKGQAPAYWVVPHVLLNITCGALYYAAVFEPEKTILPGWTDFLG